MTDHFTLGCREDRNGFVLIAVLSVLAILSVIVVALLGMSRDSVDAALLSSHETRQKALLQSGLSLAAYELFQLGLAPGQVDGQQLRFDEGSLELTVTTDASKVDLNASGKDLLAAAYVAAGLTAMSPKAFAGRVIDWRDADDKPEEYGAERSFYDEAKLGFGPRNAAFRSVDDLRWVAGVSAADVRALRPFLTVFNPRGRLNTYAALPSIIAALPKVDPATVDAVIAARASPGRSTSASLDDLLLVQASMIDTASPVTFRIGITLRPSGATVARRAEAIIAAGAVSGVPFHVLHWSGDR